MVTAKDDSEDIVEALRHGANDYVTKPVSVPVVTARIQTQLVLKRTVTALEHANKQLEQLSFIDGLTGVGNRRAFDQQLQREWRRAVRKGGEPLSVILVDVDHFKAYNDTFGHEAGDIALRSVAAALKGAVERAADMVARYGGEEFIIVLPDTDHVGVMKVAERLRQRVAALSIEHRTNAGPFLTISLGVATAVPGERKSVEELVRTADKALYEAKAAGRNQARQII
jgi:diguanylate cyclase (GGDEF)-like protein